MLNKDLLAIDDLIGSVIRVADVGRDHRVEGLIEFSEHIDLKRLIDLRKQ